MKRAFAPLVLIMAAGAAYAQDQQLGARTKAMGGSYTAFEDDPVSVWLNPAGISTQPDQMSLSYQTYTAYPVDQERGAGDEIKFSVAPETILVDPPMLPSYLGFVFQVGDAENPMAVGICFARPYHLHYAMDQISDPNQTVFEPTANVEQSLSRFRVAFAKDFRIRPQGEAGLLTHLSLGAGLDVSYERWLFSSPDGQFSDTTSSMGFGFGGLVGVYDNLDSFRVNVGLGYSSRVKFTFDIEPDILPAFDMPNQLNVGAVFYLLPGTPLRITVDSQFIGWKEVAEKPLFAGHPTFEDVVNTSIGFEYKIGFEKFSLYPRIGFRKFDAPWADADNLPATGAFKLVLDTKDEAFNIFTFGAGISWNTAAGKIRSVDLAGDTGGDSFNIAVGYTHEF
jgi:hypothetical protein